MVKIEIDSPLSSVGIRNDSLKIPPFMITGKATAPTNVIMAFAMRIIYVNSLGPMNKKMHFGLVK